MLVCSIVGSLCGAAIGFITVGILGAIEFKKKTVFDWGLTWACGCTVLAALAVIIGG